ncbi:MULTISPECIES: peptidoglycan-binding domain-containing protein [Microbacterium]|uniref:peptidoglycan-binding domain-containing protein n=1 Tax=Microbacterium TaxID=33882 RepID=UPI001EF4EEFA|nr:peptidoglycan-binding domain-containing protein [Microbacterium sp. KCTC 39802]
MAFITAGGAVGWAAASVLTPAEDPMESSSFTYVAVKSGEVGSSLSLNTIAAWTPVPVGVNRAVGVVTEVVSAAGADVVQGSVLYRVDQQPVTIGQGAVPAYRSIGLDAEGADVGQLQRLLTAVGVYAGPDDGKAGQGTIAAVKRWQKALGVEQTGVIQVADVIFVPDLPTRVALDEKVIGRGLMVSGGEQTVRALPPAPEFTLPVTDAQAVMMPAGTRVEITSPDGSMWQAVAAEQIRDEQSGTVTVSLESPDGGAICGDQCGQVPVTGEARLVSTVVTVETVAGLVVPSAALVTAADGETAVIDDEGEPRPVTVVTSARGMSIIEGVPAGTRVRVPASAEGVE